MKYTDPTLIHNSAHTQSLTYRGFINKSNRFVANFVLFFTLYAYESMCMEVVSVFALLREHAQAHNLHQCVVIFKNVLKTR